MRNRSSIPKRPRDLNSLAHFIVEQTSNPTPQAPDTRNPAAVELGRMGGLKGGKARANKLSAKRRAEIARDAAIKRWKKR